MTFINDDAYSTLGINSFDISKKFISKILIIVINKNTILSYLWSVSEYSVHPRIFYQSLFHQ
ncbi:hypothetical protein pCPXV0135 [Cowpox virus]|uniref:Uncharacterized protein n=1 Tax=Cowpox virus TaxID=10243 RepID=A0A1B5FLR1_COWPX|nr:hypothetical protein pCPXV0135 [Cowpox virus]SNB50392.1 hypothetical protein pCPXV0135 [Cowpox virus]SNB50559.1 hypothetical protein pCPXV0135 [Cowpox virus]SNB51681.1 hypothetical protein pCPXV0135 [Cowpox virus]SNB53389.1 hypothetical protein pCPXV0135 [Cowpox virus]